MKKFVFTTEITVSAYTVVVAETEEAARAIAAERGAELCKDFDPEPAARRGFIITDADGEPHEITLSSADDTDDDADTE